MDFENFVKFQKKTKLLERFTLLDKRGYEHIEGRKIERFMSLDSMTHRGLFQPLPFCDSVIN